MDFFMQMIGVGWKVGKVRSRLGRAGYDVDLMLRVVLLGQWHSL